jgi:retron-type reverse transcriptase
LLIAHKRALKGKRNNFYATGFDYNLISCLIKLQAELRGGEYNPSAYRKKIIVDPKVRRIEAPAYRDRIVHHALHHFLSPFYERFFISDSYACRPGRGIHHAVARVQHFLRQGGPDLYVCQIDVSKYYASINHDRLLELLQSKIDDQPLIDLLKVIIDSTDSGTEHDQLFAPDSYYFTKGRRGIPIGNLTSQLFANVYLHELDMYAKQTLKVRWYIRYMDDILVFHHDKAQLHIWQKAMTEFLYQNLYLTVNPHKVRLYPVKQGVSFVGYVIYPHFLRLRGSSVRRFKKRYHKQLRAMASERIKPDKVAESFASWKAHASHASSRHLVDKLESWQANYLFVRAVKRYHRKHCRTIPSPPIQLLLFDDL